MTHPCNQCEYQATSARQLSRHKAVTHVKNPLSCILCPFVTAYQTNLLRHRREVHGILGSKGNKSCKFCGFEADDNDTLIVHQQQAHQDILKSARERFAREKKSARGNCALNNSNSDNSLDETTPNGGDKGANFPINVGGSSLMSNLMNKVMMNSNNKTKFDSALFNHHQQQQQQQESTSSNNQSVNDEDDDFWKEGFIDNPASLMDFNNTQFGQQQQQFNNNVFSSNFLANFQKNFNDTFKLNAFNGLNNFNDMNLLNCLGSNLNSSNSAPFNSAYQEDALSSPDRSEDEDAASENDYSRPDSRNSKSSNLEINLQPQTPDSMNNCEKSLKDDEIATSLTATSATSNNDDLSQKPQQQQQQALAPTKIRRQYTCTDCDFKTVNPREFLYHRRDVHNQKVKIVECPYCVYACQYFQKLQRHMLLVHKLKTSITPPADVSSPSPSIINKQQSSFSSPTNLVVPSSKRRRLNNELAGDAVSNNASKSDDEDNNSDESSSIEEEDDFENSNEEEDVETPIDYSTNAIATTSAPTGKSLLEQRLSQIPPASHEPLQQKTISSSLTLRNLNDNLVKVYKCSYCDFICNTASRFHVHFVQHLNTKPFMCSVCEHRSNWAWDINKHIKMKSQKGDDHENASAVLVHHSGKRDYRKYDKYLILINKNDIDGDSRQQTDTRGLIDPLTFAATPQNNPLSILSQTNLNLLNSLTGLNSNLSLNNLNGLLGTTAPVATEENADENEASLSDDEDEERIDKMDDERAAADDQQDDEDDDEEDFNADSIMITPDISLTIGNEIMDLSGVQNGNNNAVSALSTLTNSLTNFNATNNSLALSPLLNNLTTATSSSASSPVPSAKPSKLFYCAYCDYTHRDSKSLVSHLSIHAGKKPFKCRLCGFSSNWREVLNRHVASRHSGTSADIEQLFKYTVSKYICRIIDEKGQINPGPEITTQATIKQLPVSSGNLTSIASKMAASPPYQPSPQFQPLQEPQPISYGNQFNVPNIPDIFQNSLLMLNSLLAQQLNNFNSTFSSGNNNSTTLNNTNSSNQHQSSSSSNLNSNFSNFPNLANLSSLNSLNSLTNLANDPTQFLSSSSKFHSKHHSLHNSASSSSSSNVKTPPKPVETPEILAKHGIQGKVSGFKGEFKCEICPFRAEKAFHMDFHSKRHVKAPGADFKCDYCDYWVNAKKSLVKHVYLHKYKDV